MRAITFAAVLAAGAFAGSSAFAQTDHVHHAFCMKTGGGMECAYDSFQQCQAAVKGANDSCVANSPTQNH
jgi:Fe2+ or Zn2+ uptake regulation protein